MAESNNQIDLEGLPDINKVKVINHNFKDELSEEDLDNF
jgi:hypothetical protein